MSKTSIQYPYKGWDDNQWKDFNVFIKDHSESECISKMGLDPKKHRQRFTRILVSCLQDEKISYFPKKDDPTIPMGKRALHDIVIDQKGRIHISAEQIKRRGAAFPSGTRFELEIDGEVLILAPKKTTA